MNQEIEVFRDQYLAGTSVTITSEPVAAMGNKMVVNLTVTNASSGSASTILALEGSYDGSAWERPTTTPATLSISGTIGNATVSLANLDYAYVRLHATTGAAADKTLFDASLAFSEQ